MNRRLVDQLLRAGTSIAANLEEGGASQSRADFLSKNAIALKEAREALYWLRLIAATHSHAADEAAPLINEADQLVAILTTIVRALRKPKPPE